MYIIREGRKRKVGGIRYKARSVRSSPDSHHFQWVSRKPRSVCDITVTQILKVLDSCLRRISATFKSFLTKKTLNTILESRRARLEGKTGQYRELKREAVRAVRRNKEAQVHGVCDTVESHLCSTDSRPAYRGMVLRKVVLKRSGCDLSRIRSELTI